MSASSLLLVPWPFALVPSSFEGPGEGSEARRDSGHFGFSRGRTRREGLVLDGRTSAPWEDVWGQMSLAEAVAERVSSEAVGAIDLEFSGAAGSPSPQGWPARFPLGLRAPAASSGEGRAVLHPVAQRRKGRGLV